MKKNIFLMISLILFAAHLKAMEIKTSSTFYFENFDDPKPEVEDCKDVNSPGASGGNSMVSPGQMFIKKSICQTQKNTANIKAPTDKKALFLSHEKAKKEIWKKYLNAMQPEKLEQLDYAFSKDNFNFNDYLSDCVFINDIVKKEEGMITSIVRCNINEQILDKELQIKSAAGQTTSGEGSYIAYFIVPRMMDKASIKRDDIVFDSNRTDDAASETVSVQDDGVGERTISTKSSKISKGKVDGGTRNITSDKYTYKSLYGIIDPSVIDGAFNSVLSRYHFETSDYGMLDLDCEGDAPDYDEMVEEYVEEGKLTKKTLKSAIKYAKNCGVKYFVHGSVTIDSKSEVNNNIQVNASMTTQVVLLGKRIKNVASISSQMTGEGKDFPQAARQAINDLASDVADKIAAKLNAKGIN